jgi:CO/xanthine dehydrogenase Mo-binding subunit
MVNGVAVVARSTWTALEGRRALRVTWRNGAGAEESTEAMRERCISAANSPDQFTSAYGGDVDASLAGAARRLHAVYETQLLAHATMEPMNCTAHVQGNRCEIWAPTQMPSYVRTAAAQITGLPLPAITVHVTRMGGAFGRRFYADYAGEAVFVSRALQQPVQVMWTREDDMRHGFYRPAGYHVLEGAVNDRGEPTAWSHRLFNASRGHYLHWSPPDDPAFNPGELSRDDYPAKPADGLRLGYTSIVSPIPRGQWRAVENSMNVFVSQSFMDELAHLAGQDPLEFRIALLRRFPAPLRTERPYDAERLVQVLRVAAQAAGWGGPLPRGRGRGIAAHWANESYVAQVAEVAVEPDGSYRIERVVCAVDCGLVINPLGVRAQVEGSIVFGLSALKQEITVREGRVVQGNFTDFPLLTMGEMPLIETHIVPSTASLGGMGEPALSPLAPAVTNAIFAASQIRLRRLPLPPRLHLPD